MSNPSTSSRSDSVCRPLLPRVFFDKQDRWGSEGVVSPLFTVPRPPSPSTELALGPSSSPLGVAPGNLAHPSFPETSESPRNGKDLPTRQTHPLRVWRLLGRGRGETSAPRDPTRDSFRTSGASRVVPGSGGGRDVGVGCRAGGRHGPAKEVRNWKRLASSLGVRVVRGETTAGPRRPSSGDTQTRVPRRAYYSVEEAAGEEKAGHAGPSGAVLLEAQVRPARLSAPRTRPHLGCGGTREDRGAVPLQQRT